MNYKGFGIYLQPSTGTPCVLLTDGAFTAESNCLMREYGIVWHKPQLFTTKSSAKGFMRREGLSGPRYSVRKYAGATQPFDRPAPTQASKQQP